MSYLASIVRTHTGHSATTSNAAHLLQSTDSSDILVTITETEAKPTPPKPTQSTQSF